MRTLLTVRRSLLVPPRTTAFWLSPAVSGAPREVHVHMCLGDGRCIGTVSYPGVYAHPESIAHVSDCTPLPGHPWVHLRELTLIDARETGRLEGGGGDRQLLVRQIFEAAACSRSSNPSRRSHSPSPSIYYLPPTPPHSHRCTWPRRRLRYWRSQCSLACPGGERIFDGILGFIRSRSF